MTIDEKTIKDENLGREDVIDLIQEATNSDRITAEFIYAIETGEKSGDIIFDIPDKLQSVIDDAPSGDKAIGQYLKDLVADDTITTDDVTFLIDSGALQN